MATKTLVHKSVVDQINASKLSASTVRRINRAINTISSTPLNILSKSSALHMLQETDHGVFYLYRVDFHTRIVLRIFEGKKYILDIITADDIRKMRVSERHDNT